MLLKTDETLLDGFRRGDPEALTEIYRHYRDRVERFLSSGFTFQSQGGSRRFHGYQSRADLEDAVSETFRRALSATARQNYDPGHAFERYLMRIARNHVIQQLRRAQRERTWSQTLAFRSSVTPLSGVTPMPSLSPEDEVHLAQVRACLRDCLEALSESDRRLTVWLLEGYSQREIAQSAGVGRGEVRHQIYRLRSRLESLLKVRGVPPEEALRWLDARSNLGRSASTVTDWRSGSWVGASAPMRARPLALPARFGSYLLVEKIGEGGMAEVFKAKKLGVEGFERFVAVKLMRPEVARRRTFVSMFIDEAKIASQIAHRNIGQIFELGRHEGVYFMAMEHIEGFDLRSVWESLRRLRRPRPYMACYIAAGIAEALGYAYSLRGASGDPLAIVHQDVSPRNVLISANGEVKVIDFGLAKAAIQSESARTGLRRGTLRYMSPEQLRGENVDGRSDIFSLGVLFYELLTLEHLFRGRGEIEDMARAREAGVLAPSVYNPSLPEGLEEIVLKALAGHPDDRYQGAGEMAEDLRRFARDNAVHYGARELALDVGELMAS